MSSLPASIPHSTTMNEVSSLVDKTEILASQAVREAYLGAEHAPENMEHA